MSFWRELFCIHNWTDLETGRDGTDYYGHRAKGKDVVCSGCGQLVLEGTEKRIRFHEAGERAILIKQHAQKQMEKRLAALKSRLEEQDKLPTTAASDTADAIEQLIAKEMAALEKSKQ